MKIPKGEVSQNYFSKPRFWKITSVNSKYEWTAQWQTSVLKAWEICFTLELIPWCWLSPFHCHYALEVIWFNINPITSYTVCIKIGNFSRHRHWFKIFPWIIQKILKLNITDKDLLSSLRRACITVKNQL